MRISQKCVNETTFSILKIGISHKSPAKLSESYLHNSSVDAIGALRSGVLGLLEPSGVLEDWKSSLDNEAGIGAIFNW